MRLFIVTILAGMAAASSVQAQTNHYVDLNSTSAVPPYLSWATAATNIQDAVDVAADGATVWVANGVYRSGGAAGYPAGGLVSNRVAIYKPITVRASSDDPRDTVIEGHGPLAEPGRPIPVRGVYMVNGSALVGFTVTNGYTREDVPGPPEDEYGGGICAQGRDAVISNCVIVGNHAEGVGGGVYGGTLRNCVIVGNESHGDDGGGAYDSFLVDCLVLENEANERGGGAADCTASNCTFDANSGGAGGGGINGGEATACTFVNNATEGRGGAARDALLSRCDLFNNSAPGQGGGAAESVLKNCRLVNNVSFGGVGSDPRGAGAWRSTLMGCLLQGNESAHGPGGGASESFVLNSTVVGNTASQAGGVYDCTASNVVAYYNHAVTASNHLLSTFAYSCSTPDTGGTGNITNEPAFVNPGSGYGTNHVAGDYRLLSDSPCINAGTNEAWMADDSDLDGVPRIVGPTVDLGAYEYPLTPSGIPGVWLRDHGLPTDGSEDFADTDIDGMDNRGEYQADTIPTDSDSVLRFLAIGEQWGGTRLDWKGGRDAWQFLEVREDLMRTGETWTAIYGIPPPTPLTNAVIDFGASDRMLFYRIRAER